MSETWIELEKDKGFWIDEAFVEILSYYICKTCQSKGMAKLAPCILKLYDDCYGNCSGVDSGMVGLLLDKYILTSQDETEAIQIFEDTKNTILKLGTRISTESLLKIEANKLADSFRRDWKIPIHTSSLIEVLTILQKMLRHEWESTNHGVWFKGFGNPKGVEEV